MLLPAAPATADAVRPGAQASPKVSKDYDITLVTGDVVHYTDGPGTRDIITVDRPAGASGTVHVQQAGKHTYVLPQEAMSLLAADKLDRRLFDITELVKMGYDDARSGGVPVIATYTAAAKAARSAPATPKGATSTHRLESIGGAAMKAKKGEARAFWKDVAPKAASAKSLDNGIAKLWLDGKVKATLKESVPQINAPQAWAKGFDGKGIKVAVLDTGIDGTHPDVKDRIAGEKSFIPGEDITDKVGHGTHVASTIAGTGAASGGEYKGVAPEADLLVGKVLSNEGQGSDSQVIEGMEWAKAQGADIVSMSLGEDKPDDGNGPTAQAVNALSADGGPLFVIAAGNAYDAGSIGAPGSAEKALTVAAVDKSDQRAYFSSMGPLSESYGLKPDISAPGVDITAARAAGTSMDRPVNDFYTTADGTSMATPHVAGAAAILKQRHPDWDGQRIKNALMSSSKRLTDYTPYEQGTGRVDVLAAVDTTIEATGSVPAAVYKWPHEAGDSPSTRTVTYRNTGAQDVKLDLATTSDSAAYTLSASSVTVPAGATSEVTLTLDPSKVDLDTTFSGQVIATDAATGKVAAHTGFALEKEKELYDYTVKLLDRDGKPMQGIVAVGAKGGEAYPYQVDGERKLRLPPGTYTAWAMPDVRGDAADSLGVALLIDPGTVVTKDTTVTLDASKARKVSAGVPQETETRQRRIEFRRGFDGASGFGDYALVPVMYDNIYASPTKKVTDGDFHFLTRWRLGEKRVDVEIGNSDIDVLPQGGSTVNDGKAKLSAVYAGHGSAADFAKVNARGKAVVVDRSDDVAPADRAANAIAAGAKLLIVVNDGVGRLSEWYGSDESTVKTPLSVVSVKRDAGRKLVSDAKGGRLSLDVVQRQFPRTVYDLLQQKDGAIPDASLAYTPDPKRDLARVDAKYYGSKKVAGAGYRFDIPAWGPGFGFREAESYPSERTEYVTPTVPGKGVWYEDHQIDSDGDGAENWDQRSGSEEYTAGKAYDREWFAPVIHPRFGDGYEGTVRDQLGLQVNAPMWSDDEAGHSGAMFQDEYEAGTIAIYDGDRQLKKVAGRQLLADLPHERKPYRVVAESSRDADFWKTSTRVRSEWGFDYEPVPADLYQDDLKLLGVAFDVDTSLAGDVKGGSSTEIGLSSSTQEWLDGVTQATQATLSVSYDDGKTWKPAELMKKADGKWAATVKLPKNPGGFVSLKATATDGKDLSVSQEIIRAFGLN
ncbi:S8 family peptidase [Streptomyces sp. bgisy031]|uniref:S8 family peptidase n=1 Tax=Streptomyces sp. bgisy031 TaxID=3413772 RepID=UPI003D74B9B3